MGIRFELHIKWGEDVNIMYSGEQTIDTRQN